MPVEIYIADEQLDALKAILDTDPVKNDLDIPLIERDIDGNDLGTANEYGVTFQSPYFLMPNYLPQIILNVGTEAPVDEQFSTAEVETNINIYYAFEFDPFTPTDKVMAAKLKYLARKILEYRTDQEKWFSMTLPVLEINNEVNRSFKDLGIPIAVGRISFNLRQKGFYR
jgi:hypothetical protein